MPLKHAQLYQLSSQTPPAWFVFTKNSEALLHYFPDNIISTSFDFIRSWIRKYAEKEDDYFQFLKDFIKGIGMDYVDATETCNLFHLAVNSELIKTAKWLSQKGLDINAKDKSGNTPLHTSIILKNMELFSFVLSIEDIDVNIRSKTNRTPLETAASLGLVSQVKSLLNCGLVNFNDVQMNRIHNGKCRKIVEKKLNFKKKIIVLAGHLLDSNAKCPFRSLPMEIIMMISTFLNVEEKKKPSLVM